ncbi:MAG: hypothetical protein HIU82_18615 [Proteobacteria bacterium]|nr:hypothetical protein [Pseudomonadota bacterium]
MRIAALALLLLGLAGCAPGAAPGSAGAFTASLWPDPQVSRDVAAIRAGMDAARVGADSMAARRTP